MGSSQEPVARTPAPSNGTESSPPPPPLAAADPKSTLYSSSYTGAEQHMAEIPQSQPLVGVEEQREWSSDLFDCKGMNCSNFCLSCWCPCIIFGQNVEIIDRGRTSCGLSGSIYTLLLVVAGFHFVYSCIYRTKMRRQYGISGNIVHDCCVHLWCEGCALSQEYRELESHGYDVSLGWYGNMVKQNQGVSMTTVPPTLNNGMMR